MTFKDLLGIPENTICHNRSKVDGLEAFYTFLKRYAYPIRYGDMIPLIYVKIFLLVSFFFFYRFSSQTLTIYRTVGEGRGPSFIPLYHFHPLTNIETFICNFACEMTITFLIAMLVFTRLLLDEIYHLPYYQLIWQLSNWLMMQCLFTWWIDTRFCYSDLTLETSGFELASAITLVLQANRLTKCASQPKCASLYSVHNTVSLSRQEQVCLIRLCFERYFSQISRNVA